MTLRLRARLRALFRDIVGSHRLAASALTLPTGQINLEEARLLSALAAQSEGAGPIVEIGTLFGFSTRVMALAKAVDRELITVDSYVWNPLSLPASLHQTCTAEALTDAVQHHRVRIVCQDKGDFYRSYDGPPPCLVFLDAVHTYDETKKDIEWARQAGAGVIAVHDYSAQHPGVVRAVDDYGGPAQLVGTLAVLRN